jgi:hypothetical protein
LLIQDFRPDFMVLVERISKILALMDAKQTFGSGPPDEAALEIEKACLEKVGLPLSIIRHRSPEELLDLIKLGSDPQTKAIFLAELLALDGQYNEKIRRPVDSIRSRSQAYCLLAESMHVLSPEQQANYRPKLVELEKILLPFAEDPYIHQKLNQYRVRVAEN